MMSWNFSVCGGSQDSGGATDGDLDIAMALILADAKWGGYRTQAEVLISALKQYATASCDGRRVLRPGDRWGSCADNVDKRLNPSYFSPAYYRAFAAYVPNQADFWNGLVDDTYALLAVYQQRMSGLLPDWSYSDGSTAGAYGYEACRVPWRIATDYAWSGDVRAKTLLQGLRSWAATRGGPGQAASEKNSCFVGGFALTALAEGQAEADAWFASWLSAIPQGPDPSMGDNPYYQGTLRPLYMAVAGGLFLPPFAVK
jgi:endo-1,4-beta-D-glucanase Y